MLRLIKRIIDRRSYPLNQITLSQENLIHNFQYLTSINPNIQVVPVLKSNAYGHGIIQIGKILETQKAPFLAVDSLLEAYQLTQARVKLPILIMGYIDPKSLERRKLPYSFAVWDLELAQVINKYQKGAEIHIFVDTGMHREGVPLEELRDFVKCIRKFEYFRLSGIMSHLAISDNSNNRITRQQLENFRRAIKICEAEKLDLKWKHLGGGEALLYIRDLPGNIVRTGKSLYGIGQDDQLKPVLSLKTKIAQIKKISKRESVGYNATFIAKKDMNIGVLPIGYFDGVDRRLSNKGSILVDGVKCQILGKVSMNLTTIDLTDVKNPQIGQEVIIFSNNPADPNCVANAAKICETIPYDLLVHLASSTRRTVI